MPVAVQMFAITILACSWDEDSMMARGDDGALSRIRGLCIQLIAVLVPLALGGTFRSVPYARKLFLRSCRHDGDILFLKSRGLGLFSDVGSEFAVFMTYAFVHLLIPD